MKKNSCPDINKLIENRLDLLSDNERGQIEKHLLKCQECQKKVAIESQIDKALSTNYDPGVIEDKVLMKLKVMKEIEHKNSWVFSFLTILYAFSVIAFVLLVGFLLNKIWLEAIPYISVALLKRETLTLINLFSISFLIVTLLYGFRKSICRYISNIT
ncbi:MAG: hypothetical protein ABIL44_12715 [candidate division WOR-3 bacterium]